MRSNELQNKHNPMQQLEYPFEAEMGVRKSMTFAMNLLK
jgi:hypothetical protein